MMALLRRLQSRQLLFALLVVALPAFVASRDITLEKISNSTGVKVVRPSKIDSVVCDEKNCTKDYIFSLDQPGLTSGGWSIGYYGAQLDSRLAINDRTLGPGFDDSTVISWNRFHVREISLMSEKVGRSSTATLTCKTPKGSKRIGLQRERIFVGPLEKVTTLGFLYSLYTVHIYLFSGLVIFCLGAGLFLLSKDRRAARSVALETFAISFILMVWGNFFFGVQPLLTVFGQWIYFLPTLAFGPAAVSVSALKASQRLGVSLIWVLFFVLIASLGSSLFGVTIFAVYRYMCATLVLILFLDSLQSRQYWRLSFVGLFALDTLITAGVIQGFGANDGSGLGIVGLYIGKHFESIQAVIKHHLFWLKRQGLESTLSELRSQEVGSVENWKAILEKTCRIISANTGAARVSVCYLASESPVIATFRGGEFREIVDGKLPPVFARVIQTGEALWWKTGEDLASFFPAAATRRSDVYQSNLASIVPISFGQNVYGAISITDFSEPREILDSQARREAIQDTVNSLIALLTSHLVKKREQDAGKVNEMSRAILSKFAEDYARHVQPQEVIDRTLKALETLFGVRALYFSLEPKSRDLSLVGSTGFEQEAVQMWKALPFKAREENRISPLSIAVNEARVVFIENISALYGLLATPSVEALKHSRTTRFLVVPVGGVQGVLGAMVVFDGDSEHAITQDFVKALELPARFFGFALYLAQSRRMIAQQEFVLSRFANPQLTQLLMDTDRSTTRAIGKVERSLIVTMDLRGSTVASRQQNDARALAECLSQIYESAAEECDPYGAAFDKGNGDGLIITMPASSKHPLDGIRLALSLQLRVEKVAKAIMNISGSIVILHIGEPFRGILGNAHRIAWDTCGKDINDTYLIEKKVKECPGIVLALSALALEPLDDRSQQAVVALAHSRLRIEGLEGESLLFDLNHREKLQSWLDQQAVAQNILRKAG